MKGFIKLPAFASLILTLAACSAMHDDLEECPYGLYVRFNYDYNIMRADMFPDHVGHLRLHVYDENGTKVAERVISNSETSSPLGSHGFTIYFPNDELPPGHSYRLQAVAMQKDWDKALSTRGAKYRRSEGGTAGEHHISLDHDAPRAPMDCLHHTVSNEAPLDTLWHTLKVTATQPLENREDPGIKPTRAPFSIYPLEDQMVRVEKERYTYATVALMRDTKHLNITLRQVNNPADISHEDYEVVIVDNNTHLDGNNEVVDDNTVHYSPYEGWTTRFNSDGSVYTESQTSGNGSIVYFPAPHATKSDDSPIQRTAHFDLMFNRIMMPSEPDKGGRLVIRNRKTGNTVAEMSLPLILEEGRTAYEIYNYAPQEYLDREHDYNLDFILKGDEWQSLYIRINVLSWTKRIDNITLQ